MSRFTTFSSVYAEWLQNSAEEKRKMNCLFFQAAVFDQWRCYGCFISLISLQDADAVEEFQNNRVYFLLLVFFVCWASSASNFKWDGRSAKKERVQQIPFYVTISHTHQHTHLSCDKLNVRQIICTVCMCVWYSVRTCGEQLVCAQEADSQPHDGGLVQVRADAVG